MKPSSKTQPEAAAHPLATSPNILHWDDLPTWMQTDPYIRRGYRRQLDSLSACFWSLFYLHNDFVNTWSHLLPALSYLSALICVEWELFGYHAPVEAGQAARREDVVMVHLYVVGTAICLLASAFFHATSAHSEAMAQKLLRLDYTGICFSICVTNMSSTYFGLHDKLWWQMFYNTFCILCGIGVLVVLLGPNTNGPEAALFRVLTFLALMISGFAPIVHMFLVGGFESVRQFPLMHTAIMELFYFVGTIFYLMHWPERQWPETFDIWGASHQIFHVLVAIGQFVFFLGLRNALLMSNM